MQSKYRFNLRKGQLGVKAVNYYKEFERMAQIELAPMVYKALFFKKPITFVFSPSVNFDKA